MNMRRFYRVAALAVALITTARASDGLAASSASQERPSPRAWLEKKVKQGHALATRKVRPDTPGERKWQAEAKVLIDDILDWDEMTRRSLGSNWRGLDDKQKTTFSRLLRRLIESSYRSRLRYAVREDLQKPQDVTIDWIEEDVDKTKASLEAKVTTGDSAVLLGFELRWAGDRWRVYDVAIDDLSTVRTYRSNFNKIIKNNGWSSLITRLERKIEDIDAGRSDFARPGTLSSTPPAEQAGRSP